MPQCNTGISFDVQKKLDTARKQSETLELRDVKCPVCGYKILEVFGYGHYIMKIKCQKCKFNDVVDVACFRTMKTRRNNIFKNHLSGKTKPLR